MKQALERFERYLDQPVHYGSRFLLALLIVPLVLSFTQPLWNIHMVAPQYPEGLEIDIYAYKIEGGNGGQDVQEINTLNHYIGMAPIDDVLLADLDWIPFLLGAFAILILRVAAIGNIRMLVDLAVMSTYLSAFLVWRFWYHLYQLGHDLDPEAPVRVDPFMPAFLGTKQIANFTVTSLPRTGSFLVMASVGGVLLITLWHLWLGWRDWRASLAASRSNVPPITSPSPESAVRGATTMTRTAVLSLPLLALWVLLAACGGGDETPTDAGARTQGAAPATADAAQADLAAGREYFQTTCTPCHGPQGHGDGPASSGLTPPPRNLADADWQATVDDAYLEKIILSGGAAVGKSAAMPPNPVLQGKPEVLAGVVAHLRSLAGH